MLHFAYGSNMDVVLMERRCPTARFAGRAMLPSYRFMIMREGYASIAAQPGSCVYGMLWRLAARDLAALNAYERLDAGLYRAETHAIVANRRRHAALVYVGASRVHGRPLSGYLETVIAAASAAGLPTDYLKHLARQRLRA